MWVEDLKCMHCFLKCKKKLFLDGCIFNIIQVEMSYVTFVSTQHNSFIKRIKWVGSGQSALLTGRVRVEGS